MNYLVISDAGSMHVFNFIKNTLSGRGWNVYILSHSVVKIPELYSKYYKENNITVINVSDETFATETGLYAKYKKLRYKYREIKRIGTIDVCHIHCLASSSCLLYLLTRKSIKKLILTFWGSDIIKDRKGEVFLQKKCMPYANAITLSTKHTLNVFHQKFGHSYDDKVQIVRFISGALENIKYNTSFMSREDCKRELGFPLDKVTVMIGYNADPDQHQDFCVRNLNLLDEELRDRIHVVVPLQYARRDMHYIENVKTELSKSSFSYSLLEEYFDSNKMSLLSIATDLYVNIRNTDAFSCCMKEQLYSGTIMIQGDWLEYIELDEIQWERIKIDKLEDLRIAVSYILKKYPTIVPKVKCELMWNLFSPQGVKSQWDAVFSKYKIK